jgi:hypothetical protein
MTNLVRKIFLANFKCSSESAPIGWFDSHRVILSEMWEQKPKNGMKYPSILHGN